VDKQWVIDNNPQFTTTTLHCTKLPDTKSDSTVPDFVKHREQEI